MTRPIRVLHLRDTYEIGGPGKTIIETHRAINSLRFRLHVAVFLTRHESEDTPFVSAARACGMPVHVIRTFNQYDPRLIWRIADLVNTLGIDIIHAHEVKSDVLACLASKVRHVCIVTTLHGWIGNAKKQRLLIGLDKRVVRCFDRLIAVSAEIRRELIESGVAENKLRLLHNAIVVERYRRTGQRGLLRDLVGRDVPRPVVASIGRLSREKGHADLIEALAIVRRRGFKVSAVLVGDGPERPRLVERAQALNLAGSIHFTGYVDRPQDVLEETDLMILPSHTEGLPNAALEALAMEVPVLATDVGGTREVVSNGETGRLVPPRSPEALAAAIVDFLSDPEPWKRMAECGRALVERDFNFETRTRSLEAIYSELLVADLG